MLAEYAKYPSPAISVNEIVAIIRCHKKTAISHSDLLRGVRESSENKCINLYFATIVVSENNESASIAKPMSPGMTICKYFEDIIDPKIKVIMTGKSKTTKSALLFLK
jgi:hypothetical protein